MKPRRRPRPHAKPTSAPRAEVDQTVAHGLALHQAGRLEEACALYTRALGLEPRHPEALRLLGTAALQLGRIDQAVETLRTACEAAPGCATARANLAAALLDSDRPEAALRACEAALALAPGDYDALYNSGNALLRLGEPARAAVRFREAISVRPGVASPWLNLGLALERLGLFAEALEAFERAATLAPASAKPHYARGVVLERSHRGGEAIASFGRALALDPAHHRARVALANGLRNQGRIGEASAHLDQAMAEVPDDAEAFNVLGNVRLSLGDAPGAVTAFSRAAELDPSTPGYGSNVVFATLASERATAYDAKRAAEAWAEHHVPGRRSPLRTPREVRRVGFLSPDLHFHPVGLFLEPLLRALTGVETFVFANESPSDFVTDRLKAAAGGWWDVSCLPPGDVAALVREEGIDVLVDLAGHTSRTRLDVVALQPAPLQIGWLGFSGTTGMRQFDGLIADPYVVPLGHEDRYTEPILRLPDSFVCYPPPVCSPDVAPPPARSSGTVTFGVVNSTAKYSDSCLRAWARILAEVPGSRLFLGHHALGDPAVRKAILARLEVHGADRGRVVVRGALPRDQYLAAFAGIDVALDTFPYTGATTTLDTLWMGVPVVTLAGDRYAARMSASLLATLGRPEWVAEDPDAYVTAAVRLAGDPVALEDARATQRRRLLASPLCDAPRFAEGFLATLQSLATARSAA